MLADAGFQCARVDVEGLVKARVGAGLQCTEIGTCSRADAPQNAGKRSSQAQVSAAATPGWQKRARRTRPYKELRQPPRVRSNTAKRRRVDASQQDRPGQLATARARRLTMLTASTASNEPKQQALPFNWHETNTQNNGLKPRGPQQIILWPPIDIGKRTDHSSSSSTSPPAIEPIEPQTPHSDGPL